MRTRSLLVLPLLALGLLLAPQAGAVPLEAPLDKALVLAHRGASYDAPEHTFPAYDRAVQADTDFLECDLQLTKDGVLVCIHDTTVDRTTGAQHTGRVDAYTLAQLRAMDFGSWFNTTNPTRAKPEFARARVVPFEEQLACYRRVAPRMRFHIETKAPSEYAGKLESQLVKVLKKHRLLSTGDELTSRVVVQSFELSSLEAMSKITPTVPRAFLFAVPTSPQQALAQFPDYVDIVAPTYQFLLAHPTFTTLAHDAGLPVHTYTVDREQEMEQLLDLGVDGIFTNRPDVLRRVIDKRGTGVAVKDRPRKPLTAGCKGIAGTVRGPVR
ncbi:MAG: glycerophosphodiester phosphodiesterase family protein [Mycobacteriales bacterium]|nr:glycerophosphodiester phosphodiesterase family protein [Mycobacteriales bacterium]